MEIFHPEYVKSAPKWQYANDRYNGDASTDKISLYLEKKTQRETEDAYDERKKVTEPMTHFATAVDGLNGILINKESDKTMDWGDLGDEEDPNTIAYRLSADADGEGMDWRSIFKLAQVKLTVTHRIWGMVDGLKERVYNEGTDQEIRKKTGDATIHVIDPTSVVNWFPTNGALEQVIVREKFDDRKDIDEPFPVEDVYIRYNLDGWERYKVVDREVDGELRRTKESISSGTYEYYRTRDKKERILPIYKVDIPLPRPVGYLLAIKENAIWNLESVRDFAIRVMSFALLRIGISDEDDRGKIQKTFLEGSNILWQFVREGMNNVPHEFISPDSSWLSEAGNILKKKIEDFYHNAFKDYGDAARQRTATEISLESQTGIEAFLALLVDAVDEFENQALWRIEQVYFDEPSRWGNASVYRTRDFAPKDTESAMNAMLDRVFGERERVPLPVSAVAEAVRKFADSNGITLPENDSELTEAISSQLNIIPENAIGG